MSASDLANKVMSNCMKRPVVKFRRKFHPLREITCLCGKTFKTASNRVKWCADCRKGATVTTDRLSKYGIAPGHTYTEWLNLLREHNYLCFYCKRSMTRFSWTKDHKVPLVRGGSDSIENIVPCCRNCNSRKHTMTDKEFLEKYADENGLIPVVVLDERKLRKKEEALLDYVYLPATYEDQNFFEKSNSQLVVVSSIRGRIGNRTAE